MNTGQLGRPALRTAAKISAAVRRSGLRRSAAIALVVLLIGVACGSAPSETDEAIAIEAPDDTDPNVEEDTDDSPEEESDSDAQSGERLADKIRPLPAAPTGLPSLAPSGPRPIGLTIGALDIDSAGVISVGVEENGDMEIPPADKVGWYQFGAVPGSDRGSSVLAAHIAFDGMNGVFVTLDEIELGTNIHVRYDDGSIVEFVANSKEQYDKDQLPKDAIFARSGEPQLVLITCGGDFNQAVSSYEDNVVVYATEVGNL